jgi:hypothetical protein
MIANKIGLLALRASRAVLARMEREMRRLFLMIAAAIVFVGAGLAAQPSNAMTIGAPSGLNVAVNDASAVEKSAYVCRRVWNCRFGSCGWRRSCFWRPGPVIGYPYNPYPYYAVRPAFGYYYGYPYRYRYRW